MEETVNSSCEINPVCGGGGAVRKAASSAVLAAVDAMCRCPAAAACEERGL